MERTPAEELLDLTKFLRPLDMVAAYSLEGANTAETHFANAKLALKFAKLDAGARLRAVVEEWTYERIVSEVY